MSITVSRSGPRTRGTYDDMLAVLAGPSLRGAACKNRGDWWDDTIEQETSGERAERHARAVSICGGCPTRTECLDERLTNPALEKDYGVWGGHLFNRPRSHGKCRRCGEPFSENALRGTVTRLYCTRACADLARDPDTRRGTRACHCGTPVPEARRWRGGTTCSQQCADEQRRAAQRARAAVIRGSIQSVESPRRRGTTADRVERLTAEGLAVPRIAETVGISTRQVERYRRRMRQRARAVTS